MNHPIHDLLVTGKPPMHTEILLLDAYGAWWLGICAIRGGILQLDDGTGIHHTIHRDDRWMELPTKQ